MKPTLKAIHICNSQQPTLNQKLQKSMPLPTLIDKRNEKSTKTQHCIKIIAV